MKLLNAKLYATENFNNVRDLFEPDKEIKIYDNFSDLKEKIVYLTNNINLVNEISTNGHKRLKKITLMK